MIGLRCSRDGRRKFIVIKMSRFGWQTNVDAINKIEISIASVWLKLVSNFFAQIYVLNKTSALFSRNYQHQQVSCVGRKSPDVIKRFTPNSSRKSVTRSHSALLQKKIFQQTSTEHSHSLKSCWRLHKSASASYRFVKFFCILELSWKKYFSTSFGSDEEFLSYFSNICSYQQVMKLKNVP